MNLVSRRKVDVTNSSTAETNTNSNTNQNNLTSELDDLCDKSSDLSKFEPIPSKKKLNNRRKHDTR
jgi:hypothetical protein